MPRPSREQHQQQDVGGEDPWVGKIIDGSRTVEDEVRNLLGLSASSIDSGKPQRRGGKPQVKRDGREWQQRRRSSSRQLVSEHSQQKLFKRASSSGQIMSSDFDQTGETEQQQDAQRQKRMSRIGGSNSRRNLIAKIGSQRRLSAASTSLLQRGPSFVSNESLGLLEEDSGDRHSKRKSGRRPSLRKPSSSRRLKDDQEKKRSIITKEASARRLLDGDAADTPRAPIRLKSQTMNDLATTNSGSNTSPMFLQPTPKDTLTRNEKKKVSKILKKEKKKNEGKQKAESEASVSSLSMDASVGSDASSSISIVSDVEDEATANLNKGQDNAKNVETKVLTPALSLQKEKANPIADPHESRPLTEPDVTAPPVDLPSAETTTNNTKLEVKPTDDDDDAAVAAAAASFPSDLPRNGSVKKRRSALRKTTLRSFGRSSSILSFTKEEKADTNRTDQQQSSAEAAPKPSKIADIPELSTNTGGASELDRWISTFAAGAADEEKLLLSLAGDDVSVNTPAEAKGQETSKVDAPTSPAVLPNSEKRFTADDSLFDAEAVSPLSCSVQTGSLYEIDNSEENIIPSINLGPEEKRGISSVSSSPRSAGQDAKFDRWESGTPMKSSVVAPIEADDELIEKLALEYDAECKAESKDSKDRWAADIKTNITNDIRRRSLGSFRSSTNDLLSMDGSQARENRSSPLKQRRSLGHVGGYHSIEDLFSKEERILMEATCDFDFNVGPAKVTGGARAIITDSESTSIHSTTQASSIPATNENTEPNFYQKLVSRQTAVRQSILKHKQAILELEDELRQIEKDLEESIYDK